MRISLCVFIKDRIYKITWFNEDRHGIYIGFYGELGPSHFSYHKDGKAHLKIVNPDTKKITYPQKHQSIPIKDITAAHQILFNGLVIKYESTLHSEYKHDQKSNGEIFFSEKIFKPQKHISTDIYLVSKTNEKIFLEQQMKRYEKEKAFRLISMNLFELKNFPQHKMALLFLATKSPLRKNHGHSS